MQTRLVNITFDTATSALASEMINDAEAEVNKYLSRRYDIGTAQFQTTTSIPPIVKSLSTTLAEGFMWGRMSRGSKESLTRGKELIKMVTDNLALIANFGADLLDSNGAVIPDSSSGINRVLFNTEQYANTFNEDDSLSWRVDSDKLSDIANERD